MTLTEKLQMSMGWILNIGVLTSLLCVSVGSIILWCQHGELPLDAMLLPAAHISINPLIIWQSPWTAISLIEFGLFILIGTQVMRVALLAGFYAYIRDGWFTFFSLFILVVLGVSFLCR